jgi:hypothetical protein
MAKVLKEYFGEVKAADAYRYGYGPIRDYLTYPYETNACDWVITNPPFRLAEEFVLRSLRVARRGVAILARTVFLESSGRIDRDFPHQVALTADTVQLHYWAIEDFCRGRSRAPRGHSVFHNDMWWHVSCFANADDAAEFRERFKGEPFNPDDRGRGSNWARWNRR